MNMHVEVMVKPSKHFNIRETDFFVIPDCMYAIFCGEGHVQTLYSINMANKRTA
jgi:hypothetical protein